MLSLLAASLAGVAALGAAAPAAPPALLWPLAIDDGLAASFGELRGDRLHTGIDLRTRGETGFEVRAAAAGEVVRIKEEWRGYGLALYLQHPGGLVTVYAHLERVTPALEARLAAVRRERRGRFAGDVEVSPARPVAAGETIAWSGETGAGLPHLHFEVRDGMDRPVDPFSRGLAPPADLYPPVAEELVIEPASAAARVNGAPAPLVLPLQGGRGRYRAAERPVLSGPVRLELRAYDRAGAENWAGLGSLAATLDGAEVYRLRFDAIPFAASQTAGAILDLARSHISPSFYTYRLSRLEGAILPFTSGHEGAFRLEPGRHRLEIDLGDVVTTLGARTRVTVDLVAEPETSPEVVPTTPGGGAILARPGEGGTLRLGDRFALTIGKGDVYAEARLVAEETTVAPSPDGLVAIGPAVRLTPAGHPFRAPVEVAIAGATARAGIYRLDPYDGSWGLEDMGGRARVRRLGTYALIEDRAPPVIAAVLPSTGSEVEPGPRSIEARVSDLGSGIPERGVTIAADGVDLDVLYDPDRGTARAGWEARECEHELRVRVTDRAGNAAVASVRVRARRRE